VLSIPIEDNGSLLVVVDMQVPMYVGNTYKKKHGHKVTQTSISIAPYVGSDRMTLIVARQELEDEAQY
jgi:hypothetical protein